MRRRLLAARQCHIVYLSEVIKPKVLFSFRYLNRTAGPTGHVFEGRTFLSFVPRRAELGLRRRARPQSLGSPRLQRLELLAQDDRELATLDATKAVCLFLRVEQKSPTTSIAKYWKFAT